jgi:hypothetical protein
MRWQSTHISPEVGEQMRTRYLAGATVPRILDEFDVSLGTLYRWLDGNPPGGPKLTPVPRRRLAAKKRLRWAKASREATAARLWRALELQVRDIELRSASGKQKPAERDRDARTLAMFARAFGSFPVIEAMSETRTHTSRNQDEQDDDVRDIDEFRRDLARKIDGIIAERGARISGEPDGNAD